MKTMTSVNDVVSSCMHHFFSSKVIVIAFGSAQIKNVRIKHFIIIHGSMVFEIEHDRVEIRFNKELQFFQHVT
jgi:hypothetical protein